MAPPNVERNDDDLADEAIGAAVNPHLRGFLAYLRHQRGRSAFTLRNYGRDIREFLTYAQPHLGGDLESVQRGVILGYLDWLQNHREPPIRSRRSLARMLSALRSFYRFLAQHGALDTNPMESQTAPKLGRRIPSFLTQEEVGRLLQAVQGGSPAARRDRALLELLYASGVRASELVRLDLADLNLSAGEARVFGKGSKERIVLIGGPACAALAEYLSTARPVLAAKARRPIDALFLNDRNGGRLTARSVQLLVKRYAAQAGLDKRVYPHLMRHTFATHLLDGGADLRVVQELLGHASLASTQVYTHVSQAQARRTYLKAHPRAQKTEGGP